MSGDDVTVRMEVGAAKGTQTARGKEQTGMSAVTEELPTGSV